MTGKSLTKAGRRVSGAGGSQSVCLVWRDAWVRGEGDAQREKKVFVYQLPERDEAIKRFTIGYFPGLMTVQTCARSSA
jgi:hypothetical protein